jgi:hypothetical protein
MNFKSIAALAAVIAPTLFVSTSAFAQEERDGARFRGAVSAEGGAIIVPDAINVGLAGVQGQLGVQINHLVGVYAVPQLDIVFGEVGGVHLAAAAVVDFSIIDEVSIGVGPEIGVFGAVGASDGAATAAGGAMYGGRLHFGFQPVWGRGEDGIRRKALSIGLDIRFLAGEAGFARASATTAEAAVAQFVLSPMLSIGYQAF